MTIANTVEKYLKENSVKYHLEPHPASYCAKDTAKIAHLRADHLAKAVILQDKNGFLMTIIPGENWVDLDAVKKALNREMSIAPEGVLSTLFDDCEPGAIPPLGPAYAMETVVDDALSSLSNVYFEAGDHENLVHVSGKNFGRLMSGIRHGHYSTPN